ncbi:MAG: hypothetical protein EB060_01465 [Proteobacteria bacterium]|nr:hypothetical protein [Pseudomonadota bacterium]
MILFIILITVGVVWWIGYDGAAPDIVDTGTLQTDMQMKEYQMKHGAVRAVRKAVDGNPNQPPPPPQVQQQQQQEQEEEEGPTERARVASHRVGGSFSRASTAIKESIEMLINSIFH